MVSTRLPSDAPFTLGETSLNHLPILNSFYRSILLDALRLESEVHKSPSSPSSLFPPILFTSRWFYSFLDLGA